MKMALMMYGYYVNRRVILTVFCTKCRIRIQHANGRLRKWNVISGDGGGGGKEDLVFGEGIRFCVVFLGEKLW